MHVTGAKWILGSRMNDPQEGFIGDTDMQKEGNLKKIIFVMSYMKVILDLFSCRWVFLTESVK